MHNLKFSKIVLSTIIFLSTVTFISAATQTEKTETLPIERYALYVASNDGGVKRETLKYAGTDAKQLAQTMFDIGGIKAENSLILTDPSKAEIDKAFKKFKTIIEKSDVKSKRTEFIFYYSGHSDENAFLLGNETYDYTALKTSLTTVPTDVHVVMLDSCFSGNFVRAKGGSREKAFLVDDATIVQGHAYLSSSAEDEASQESDTIQASYFTHALVTGLRGAADSSGDGKVSLNELYYYAFNETLSSTELSSIGPQHPSYNITLVGSGDLVLTDISIAESSVYIPSEYEGTYFFRNKDGMLVSEITKINGTEIALALPSGFYSVTLLTGDLTKQRNILLEKGQRLTLDTFTFGTVAKTSGRSRGNTKEAEEDIEYIPFSISLFPGFEFPSTASTENVNISVGVLMAKNKNIFGVQANAFAGLISEDLTGVQASGFMNITKGTLTGLQAAGFMNLASGSDFLAVQGSGFLNNTNGNFAGVQSSGFLNNATADFTGFQSAGFLNMTWGELIGVQGSGFLNIAANSFTGAQITSFLNIARGENKGAQLSGFLNIADTIGGAQIGIINIANSNTGIALGIINVIQDGIISPALYYDTTGNIFIQYQGGTSSLFTTLLCGTNIDMDGDYAILGIGLGTKVKVGNKISFDFEILSKQVLDFSEIVKAYDNAKTEAEREAAGSHMDETLNSQMIPSVRITANYSFFRHLGVFASIGADANITDYNDDEFTYGSYHNAFIVKKDVLKLYPSFSFGIKF